MDPILLIVTLLSIILFSAYSIHKHFTVWKRMGAPYEVPHLFYGNLKDIGKSDTLISRLHKIYERQKANGPFVGLFVFFKPAALITDLQLVKDIMIKDFGCFQGRGLYYNEKDDPLSAHLFNIAGVKWRLLRTKFTPAFTSGKMKMIFPTLMEVSQRLEEKIKSITETNNEIDIKQVMSRFTTDVIGTTVFGIECDSLNEENNHFYQMGILTMDKPRHSLPVQLLLLSFQDFAIKCGIKRFRDEVSNFFTQIVRSTVDHRIANKIHRNDFMDILLELYQSSNENKLSFEELAGQALVFFVAGYETSSSLLQFCIYELARNPDVQTETRNHIEAVIEKYNGEFTYEAMFDMKYVDQVLYETLRMYPPLATHFRETDKDYKVPGTNFTFKKGTLALISAYAIQRDNRFYENPDIFNPENFSEENVKKRPAFAHIPFGEGPRNCIGARFGMMQARVGLVAALRDYHYELSPKTEVPLKISPTNFITTIVGGVWLKVKRIK